MKLKAVTWEIYVTGYDKFFPSEVEVKLTLQSFAENESVTYCLSVLHIDPECSFSLFVNHLDN